MVENRLTFRKGWKGMGYNKDIFVWYLLVNGQQYDKGTYCIEGRFYGQPGKYMAFYKRSVLEDDDGLIRVCDTLSAAKHALAEEFNLKRARYRQVK